MEAQRFQKNSANISSKISRKVEEIRNVEIIIGRAETTAQTRRSQLKAKIRYCSEQSFSSAMNRAQWQASKNYHDTKADRYDTVSGHEQEIVADHISRPEKFCFGPRVSICSRHRSICIEQVMFLSCTFDSQSTKCI